MNFDEATRKANEMTKQFSVYWTAELRSGSKTDWLVTNRFDVNVIYG